MSFYQLFKQLRLYMFIGLLCFVPVTVRADSALIGVGTLLDHATHILVGVVQRVDAGPTPGSQRATLAVEQNFRGSVPPTFTLPGSTIDPYIHNFVVGVRFLAFLKAQASGGFTPIGGFQGLIALPEGTLDAALAMAGEWLVKGKENVRLADMRDDMRQQDHPAPPVLMGAMMEEMSVQLKAVDIPLVVVMACNRTREFPVRVQTWAIQQVGPLKIAAARSCVEQFLTSGTDGAVHLAATEALGALGDRNSVRVLLPLLTSPGNNEEPGISRDVTLSAVLALGKLGDPSVAPELMRLARQGDDFALHSTIVHALGLIGGPRVTGALTAISRTHANPLIREQAQQTLERIRKK
jgi:hypothetical protein